eukprot:CAMPEP_0172311358 /NCGR_PEP_ID=MMETSP1058-20130122/14625_1 /TAXON_ID=83371 /ORGANISM="Detonula confervacea, Strain CCMP 353" /LENGTH=337 /DNA_ID=CAMNT_0013024517 /DNA_START=229 /DNA_END=1243 /DNA_ORIENTATION=-
MATTLGKDIDGKSIAATVRAELAQKLSSLTPTDSKPGLAVMLVGSRKDSQTYVRMKQKACADCGMASFLQEYKNENDQVTEEQLLAKIQEWNDDPKVHGILVQLPLPSKIDEARILKAVDPLKDVDGLHPANTASLFNTATHAGNAKLNWKDFSSIPFHIPCTPQGCIELLDRVGVDIEGKNAVVIGRSNLVGLPVAMLLCHRNATVTIVHSRTKNTENVVKQADIVVAAVGRAHMVPASWLKEGCTVIDVGINSVDAPGTKRGYRLVGDVKYEEAKEVAEWITPVPGGVGPMTIAMLLRNTWNSWRRITGVEENGGNGGTYGELEQCARASLMGDI